MECIRGPVLRYVFIYLLSSIFLVGNTLTSSAKIQASHFSSVPDSAHRAQAVRETFRRGFQSYKKYAWGNDEVRPLTLRPNNTRNGWGATIVDAMPTLHIMGLSEEFAEAVKFVSTINFRKTNDTVSVFETTIRYIGGMMSAYEATSKAHPILLKKAVELGDKLMFAWQNGSALPFGFLNFTNNSVILTDNKNLTNLAEAGTLILEYYKLSKYSGNSTYFQKADQAMKAIMNNKLVFPGLPALDLDPMDGRGVGDWVSWGGECDSYYEYLVKFSHMTGHADARYMQEWAKAVDSSFRHLIRTSASNSIGSGSKPSRSNLKVGLQSTKTRERMYISSVSPKKNRTRYQMSHLSCFMGGNWMLGGKLLNNRTIVDAGLELTKTCSESYLTSKSGIGPEVFGFIDKTTNQISAQGEVDLERYDEIGFFLAPDEDWQMYYLRPEVLESMFYAYRVTGDSVWQDIAWKAFNSIKACCEISEESGLFAPLERVDRVPTRNFQQAIGLLEDGPNGWEDGPNRMKPEYGDVMESFWFAEPLKYLYLIFSDPMTISLDEYVFTTESHPIRIETGSHDWQEMKAL